MRSAVLWLLPICLRSGVSARPQFLRSWPKLAIPIALTGRVSSADEGPMEGVLVSAKKTASTITITVVSDREGRYRFPAIAAGARRVRRCASARPATISSAPRPRPSPHQKTTTLDLKLQKTRDLASQLTNADWFASFPGTDAQKASIRGCTHCHTLERIVRTHYDADRMMTVIERMSTYPQLSFPLRSRSCRRRGSAAARSRPSSAARDGAVRPSI